jgi:hypothetical protein
VFARPLPRRTALVATAAMTGLAVGACTSDSPDDPANPTDPSDPAGPTGTSAPPVDADQDLATGVAVDIASLGVFVDSLAQDFPALRSELRPLRRMHDAHLEAVGGFDDSIPSPPPNPGGPEEARGALVRYEQRHQRDLAAAAVSAESGTLAKLLASMSAAVAQHLAVLR